MNEHLTLEDFIVYCQGKKKIDLSKQDIERVRDARAVFERLTQTEKIYGVNTGVGKLVEKKIGSTDQVRFQKNIIMSHACGVGENISLEESRGVLLLLINMLRRGKSAASDELVIHLTSLFNQDLIPAIPEKGSLGASGDLVPLAHLALVLLHKGSLFVDQKRVPAKWFLRHGFPLEIELKAGEALTLINGTHFMSSLLAHSVRKARILSETADICAAMTHRALNGKTCAFDRGLQWLRPHPGAIATADNLRRLLGKECRADGPLQDPYCLRCLPQIHGVAKEEIAKAKIIIEREMNSVTCNPIMENGKIYHGGNFHGQNLSQAADALSIVMATLANAAERRIDGLFSSPELPAFLVEESGLNSGLMIAQYTAASLVSENKTLAHPASVDSISVACGQEDFVSMGGWAVRKLREICRNTGYVLAIELLCAAQALDFRTIDPKSTIAKVHWLVREKIPHLDSDRIFSDDIKIIFDFVWSGEFLEKANKTIDI